MTDFRRRDARDLVVRILTDGLPLLAGRVFRARVWPMKAPETPAALVYGWHETKTRKTLDVWTHQFEVACGMAIECRVQATNGPDTEAAMENMARDVETAILTSPLLLGLTTTIERIDRVETKIEAEAKAEMVQGTVSMSFDLVWTEIHQVVVPSGEVEYDFSINSFPTIY